MTSLVSDHLRDALPVPALLCGGAEQYEDETAECVDLSGQPEHFLPVTDVIVTIDDEANDHRSHKSHGVAW